jgi:hypothetical protein
MKAVRVAILGLLVLFGLVFAGDYLVLRYKMSSNRQPFGTVEVQPYYAVPLKDGKTEFIFLKPENHTCVNSLFPHVGKRPCWYLRKHRDRRIDI